MTGLNIYLKKEKVSEKCQKILPLCGECWLIAVHLQPMEKICSWDPLELSESPPVKSYPSLWGEETASVTKVARKHMPQECKSSSRQIVQ